MTGEPPRVFLLPGIFGDETPLTDLRAALAGRIEFDLLDYPDIDRPSGEIRNFAGIIERTIERIRSLQPSGDVHITGHSFGGLVGFAAACRLQEEGRRVGLLALLDSRALDLKVRQSGGVMRNHEAAPGLWGAGTDVISRLLIAAGLSEVVRRAIQPTGRLFGSKAAHALRLLLLQNLRGRALNGLTLGRFDGPILLFRALAQPDPSLPPDLGWNAHCAAVRSVPVAGDHTSMPTRCAMARSASRNGPRSRPVAHWTRLPWTAGQPPSRLWLGTQGRRYSRQSPDVRLSTSLT